MSRGSAFVHSISVEIIIPFEIKVLNSDQPLRMIYLTSILWLLTTEQLNVLSDLKIFSTPCGRGRAVLYLPAGIRNMFGQAGTVSFSD
jgi:hypothetical protein